MPTITRADLEALIREADLPITTDEIIIAMGELYQRQQPIPARGALENNPHFAKIDVEFVNDTEAKISAEDIVFVYHFDKPLWWEYDEPLSNARVRPDPPDPDS